MDSFLFVFSIVFVAGLALLNVFAYRSGFKDGCEIGKGKPMPPLLEPLVTNPRKSEGDEDKMLEGLNNLLTYDGEPPERK